MISANLLSLRSVIIDTLRKPSIFEGGDVIVALADGSFERITQLQQNGEKEWERRDQYLCTVFTFSTDLSEYGVGFTPSGDYILAYTNMGIPLLPDDVIAIGIIEQFAIRNFREIASNLNFEFEFK